MDALREDRFTGCLLGVAVGDALGQPIEAFPPERLRREFGEIREFTAGDPRLPMPLGPGSGRMTRRFAVKEAGDVDSAM